MCCESLHADVQVCSFMGAEEVPIAFELDGLLVAVAGADGEVDSAVADGDAEE